MTVHSFPQEKNRRSRLHHLQQFYKRKKETMSFLIKKIWNLYPDNKVKRCKLNCLRDNKENYGGHQLDLGFDEVVSNEEAGMRLGTGTMGIRYENEHWVPAKHRLMCEDSEENVDFILAIRELVHTQYPNMKPSSNMLTPITDFMRVQLVVGARTGWHVDTMRGPTPNLILIEPGSNFTLHVRKFPDFRTSVVKYDGNLFIPTNLSPKSLDAELTMIGLKDGKPWFYVFPEAVLDKMEAHGKLPFTVIGIKEHKLQVIPLEPILVPDTKILVGVPIKDAFDYANEHPAVKPKHVNQYINDNTRFGLFYGWKHAHRWLACTDHLCRRLHIFFRLVREETPTARKVTNRNWSAYEIGSKLE